MHICVFRLSDYKTSGDKLNEEETDVAVSRTLTAAADFSLTRTVMSLNEPSSDLYESRLTDTENIETADPVEVNLESVFREHTSPGDVNVSVSLMEIIEDDSLLTDFLTEPGTSVAKIDQLPLNALDDISKTADETGSESSDAGGLSVAVEADSKDESLHADAGYSVVEQGASLSSLTGMFIGTDEAESSQQSKSSVYHEALVDVNDEDETVPVSDDISETAGGEDASECTENNGPAEFSDSDVFFSSSECAINTTVVESEHAIEPQLQQDFSDVADADRAAECINSPAPVNDNGVMQADDHNEQHVLTGLPSSAEGMMDSSINSAESVDDAHGSSSLVRCSSEAENTGIELLPEDNDSLNSDAAVTCSTKGTLSLQNCSSLPANDVSVSMEHCEGDVHLESSSVAETEVKAAESNDASNCIEHDEDYVRLEFSPVSETEVTAAESNDASNCMEHGEDDINLELSSVTGTEVITAESGIIIYTSNEIKCDVLKSAVELAEPLAGGSELSNAAVSVPDAAVALEHAAGSDETSEINCGDVALQTSNVSATEQDASVTLVPDAASLHEYAAGSDQTQERSYDISPQASDRSATQEDTTATSVQHAATLREHEVDIDQVEINCGDLSLHTSDVSTTVQNASATSVQDAATSHDHAADSDQMEINYGFVSLQTSEGSTTEQDASVTLVPDTSSSHEHAASSDQTLERNYDMSPQAYDRSTTEKDASAISVQDAARSRENEAGSVQTSEVNYDDISLKTSERCTIEQEASVTSVLDAATSHEHAADSGQTSEINSDDVSHRSATDTFESDSGSKQNVNSDADLSVVPEVKVISTTSGNSCTEDSVSLSRGEVMAETISSTSTVVLVSSVRSTVATPVSAAVELESHRKTNDPSSIIILKNLLASTQPSDVSIPSSSSSVLSRTLSTAGSLVTNPIASIYQLPQTVITSVTESKSTSSVMYRPAAALTLNLGKNLVTEFVFQEIVAHEDKWKSASAAEKVPANI